MTEPQEITFYNGPPQPGLITLFTTEEETKLRLNGVPAQSISRSRRVRKEELLAMRGTAQQRVRVAFIEDTTTTTDPAGKKERTVEPFVGGTYEIERTSETTPVTVFDAAGAKVRFGVAAQIAGLYRDFGRDEPSIKLPAGPQRVGQSAPEIAESMATGIARGATISKVEKPEATLDDIRPGPGDVLHARYRLSLEVTAKASGSVITMHLTGSVLLRDVDGVPLEIRIDGPFENVAEVPGGKIPGGEGTFKMTQTMVYARA